MTHKQSTANKKRCLWQKDHDHSPLVHTFYLILTVKAGYKFEPESWGTKDNPCISIGRRGFLLNDGKLWLPRINSTILELMVHVF